MNKIIAGATLLVMTTATVHAAEAPLPLTLQAAIGMAVSSNLDVRTELYNPAIAESDYRRSRGVYDTRLTLLSSYQNSTTLPASIFLSGASTVKQKEFKYNLGLNQLVPTGGNLGLAFNNSHLRSNSNISLSDYYRSDLSLSLSQPLLKNFGREPTELGIAVAAGTKEASLERFRAKLMDIVAQVRTQYFRLYTLREDLAVKRVSLELARKILSDTEARVKAGVLPAMEILNAEFGLASREKDLIDAERALSDQQDLLRVLLQLPAQRDVDATDPPSREMIPLSKDELIKAALAARPELQEQRVNLRIGELQARVAKNRTLPDLALTAGISLTGLATAYNRDLERVGSTNYPVWNVGLQFDYPLGNRAAENDYLRSRLLVDQARTQIRSLEENVANEVRTAIRGVEAGYKQIEVTSRGSAYAEERLRSFIKKNEVGLATTKDVLDVENDLTAARSNVIKALSGYNDAVTQLWRSTGMLLEKQGVMVNSAQADALYDSAGR